MKYKRAIATRIVQILAAFGGCYQIDSSPAVQTIERLAKLPLATLRDMLILTGESR